jgi:replicative DNA helicase
VTTFEQEIDPSGWTPTEAIEQAERALIGAVIQSRRCAEDAAEILTPEMFFKSLHRVVFEVVLSLLNSDRVIDPPAVLGELHRRGQLVDDGGDRIIWLIQHAAMPHHVASHARAIAQDATRRDIHDLGAFIQQSAGRPSFDLDSDLDLIRKRFDAATSTVMGDEPATAAQVLVRVLDDLEQPVKEEDLLPPPYLDLQKIIPGLRPGQLIGIGARPGTGKSTVALDFARYTALHLRLPVAFFTLEMTADECMHRILAAETGVDLARFQAHTLTDNDWTRVTSLAADIAESNLDIDDHPECTLGRIRAHLRRKARTNPVRLVIIDYLQLMQAPKAESRERAVAEISRGLKLMAMEFRVPIIVLAQLNRHSEQRQDKRPQASDFRESGALEQDVDIALMLFREDVYNKESARAGELDLIVAKHRGGPTGTATVAFQGHYARAVDMAWTPTKGIS